MSEAVKIAVFPAAPSPAILNVDELAGLDRDLEEFEMRLRGRRQEIMAAAERLKALVEMIRLARSQPEGKP